MVNRLKGFNNFSGADEVAAPQPSEYTTEHFEAILDNPTATAVDLQKAIDKTNYYINEFNRQIGVHTASGNTDAVAGVTTWLNTAQQTHDALVDKLKADANTTPTDSTGISGWGIFGIVSIVVALGAATFFIIRHKNKTS